MGLLLPDLGLLFWMSLAFIVVLLIVGKVGVPMLVGSISKRKEYIDSSLDAARSAREQLEGIQAEHDRIVTAAQDEKMTILHEAAKMRDSIISEAKAKAESLSQDIVQQARERAQSESREIIAAARYEVARLAVAVSEKVLREKMRDPEEQIRLCERLIDEVKSN